MTKLGKLLAIFVAVASLAFAGFAVATTFGGPDWQVILRQEAFRAYRVTRGGEPDFLWTAIRSSDDGQVASSKKLPEVLVKIMDDILQRQQTELSELTGREPALKERVALLEQAKTQDEAALARYETEYRERLAETRKQESITAGQVLTATGEAQKLENIISLRREDILRLQQEIEELKADQFRLEAIQTQLQNLLIQVQGDNARAQARWELLNRQTAP